MREVPEVLGLPPIVGPGATALFLGNAPSVLSLATQQYYGNPQNAFWRITAELFGFAADAPYEERTAALIERGVAVWDVLKFCRRAGSLDSAVERDSMVANDFPAFFASNPGITRVYFTGGGAQANYRRLVRVDVPLTYLRLPSSSPAHTVPYATKLAAWRAALRASQSTGGLAHGRTDSNCAASDSSVASSCGRPTSWIDIGSPLRSSPHGTDAAG